MAQLRPYMFRRTDRFVLADGKVVPNRTLRVGHYTLARGVDKEVRRICKEHGITSFEVADKHYGYLAEPAKATAEYIVGESNADVAAKLIERYYTKDTLDADETHYKAWLQAFVAGTR